VLKFAGQTLASKSLVLVQIKLGDTSDAEIVINCEKIVIGSMLVKEIKKLLETA
jgi:AP-3 complex subunit beta